MPLDPQQTMRSAALLQSQGRLAEAESMFRQLIAQQPDFHPAYHGLGLVAYRAGKLETAAELIASALTLADHVAVYFRDCGELMRRLGNTPLAIEHGLRAVELAPDVAGGHYNLGLAYAEAERWGEAVECYQQATVLKPNYGLAFNNMGSALEKQDEVEGAEAAYRTAVDLNPKHAEAQNNLGALLSRSGRIEESRVCLESALEADPLCINAHLNLAPLKRYTAEDPQLLVLEQMAGRAEALSEDERTRLYFTLGKARDDAEHFSAAFDAYTRGNALKRRTFTSNDHKRGHFLDPLRAHFTAPEIQQFHHNWPETGVADATPVFIVGMPRSGTSLIEQILASHSGVYGAGELKDLHLLVHEHIGADYLGALSELDGAAVTEVGKKYLAGLRGINHQAAQATRITDKMPGNFHYLGLIHLALPQAKIIHARRDPMDSCLSCYTKLFNDTMEFSYGLDTLADYYAHYTRLMDHWRTVLPQDFILDVSYEALVADMEGETRKILAHIGLQWEEGCIEFYNTERPVRTASLAQVRRPIYQSSVGGWKRFESQLQPLLDAVADYR